MESSARVSVRGSLGEQLVEILKKEGEDGPPRCYILDPKCIGQISSFRSVPVGDSSIYKTLSSILFEKGMLRACDVVILPDGRSSKNTTVIKKEILKPGRASKHLPARASVQIRLMYHNKEFNPETGVFRKRKGKTLLHAYLPDPLETLHVVAKGDFFKNMEPKDRKHVDVPGLNTERGWANLSLRTVVPNAVSKTTKDLIFQNSSPGTEPSGVEDDGTPEEETLLGLCPWEGEEAIALEILNCFTTANTVVIDLAAGSGIMCTASCRTGRKYYGFTQCLLQSQLVRETAA